ncbi:MAG TPA: hypothetical protein VLA56_05040 [Pseudomonadales bacterium]|nr:hypothetical protein [Pseudomonadales bacterium]
MAAILMALVISVFVAGVTWLLVGSRFAFDADDRQNDLLNLGAYVAFTFVAAFAAILWWTL